MTKVVNLHRNNRHKNGYDFTLLCQTYPALQQFIRNNKFNNQPTIDFSNSDAVVALNAAILAKDYQIKYWQIPKGYLCPPIPGRVDYIHHLAELLENSLNNKKVKQHLHQLNLMESSISAVDIGTGASCIYPILGQREYNWRFVGSDIDPVSVKVASDIIKKNKGLSQAITCRLQPNVNNIFKDIIQKDEFYHLTLCNPPFHKSLTEAQQGSQRKWKNLNNSSAAKHKALNFGGQKAELWCNGGELAFIKKMIKESVHYQKQVLWFTTLVSKKENVGAIKLVLKKAQASNVELIKMAQGNKNSRFIAWSFFAF